MPLKPFEPKRTYQHIAEKIAEMIRSGEFSLSERLPPERDLGVSLQVSRNVVREALLSLEIAGYVSIRHGVGTIVISANPSANFARLSNGMEGGISPSDIMAARRSIEGEIAALAALTATEEEIEGLKEAVSEIVKGDDFPAPEADWSRVFHQRLAAATHNGVWSLVNDDIWELMRSPLMETIRIRTKIFHNRRRRQKHRKQVIACIENRDPSGARKAMEEHIDTVMTFLFEKPVS